jgi:ribonuclease D
MLFVSSDTELQLALRDLAPGSAVALDTEFAREDTYFPILCLVQVCSGDHLFCVDALALSDPAKLAALFAGGPGTVILHAAYQDLELFLQETGALPDSLFDTQIAAAMTGFDAQISYAQLVHELLGVTLEKSQTRTDWRRRPLSDAQLEYAADDVRYLAEIQPLLAARLEESGRTGWHAEECARMLDPRLYRTEPELAWRRLKGIGRLDRAKRAVARRLAAWRESEAIRRNKPRQWIVRDRVVLDLAARQPADRAGLAEIEGVNDAVLRRYSDTLLDLLARPIQEDPADTDADRQFGPLTREQRATVKALRALLERTATATGISAGLLANRADLERLVRGQRDIPALAGWRRSVLGEELLTLLES